MYNAIKRAATSIMIIVSSTSTEYNIYMNKSSFLTGLLNTEKKNIAEYLATWDDLNVFFKTLDNAWDFVSQVWKSEVETNLENEMAFRKKVDNYLNTPSKYGLHVSLYGRFTDIFDIEHGKISSQKELDDYCIELEKKAALFQKELSREEDKMKDFNEPIDGIVYGVTVSLGFATLENFYYVYLLADYFAETPMSIAILRSFSAIPAHAIFGATMGYFFMKYSFIAKKNNFIYKMKTIIKKIANVKL